MGFLTCDLFGNGAAKEPPKVYKTGSRACPRCNLGGAYDHNMIRMVERMGSGFKWGAGPGRDDWGWEVKLGKCVIL